MREDNRVIPLYYQQVRKGKALSLTCSSFLPIDFMLEQTTWNSFKFLFGSSLAKFLNVSNRCISLDLSSNHTFMLGYTLHKGCCFKSGTSNSLSTRSTVAISFCSVLDSLEKVNSIISSYIDPFDLKL